MRGQLEITMAPKLTASGINLSADKELWSGFLLNSAFIHIPAQNSSELRLGISKKFGMVGYSGSVAANTSGGYSVSFGLSTSLAADRFNRQAVISAESLSPTGMIAVSALTAPRGDIPVRNLPGVGFLVNGSSAVTIPGSKGVPVIIFLQPDMPVEVTIDLTTVEDPFMVPKEEGCHINPRAGVVSACQFTMVTGGEIDGMVLVRLKAEQVPLKGVRVDLMTSVAGGKLVASTQSEESGYYLFKGVKPGSYNLVIPEAELARLKIAATPPLGATMPEGGDQISGKDFNLEVIGKKKETVQAKGS